MRSNVRRCVRGRSLAPVFITKTSVREFTADATNTTLEFLWKGGSNLVF